MQLFRSIDYIKIAIANHYGLDKKTWEDRLDWLKAKQSFIVDNIDFFAFFA